MKRVFLFLLISGLTTMVAFSQKKEIRQVSGFTGIKASGIFDITVTKGSTESLTIETDDNVMTYVRSEVKNGVLNLYLSNSNDKQLNINSLKAFIVMKNLDNVTLSGACKLTTADLFFTPEKFKADCSSASKMDVNLNAGQLSIEASGASNIQINAVINGDADIDISGAAKIQGDLKAKNVSFGSSGACLVDLTGSATNIKINASGTSKFNMPDFVVKTATVESSGVCNLTVNVTDVLKVNSSGFSSVDYKGSPAVEINKTQAARVEKI